jgi:hypothetical protein
MRKSQGEMLELEETFGMDRVFEGLTSVQRKGIFMSGLKALSWWVNGLIRRKLTDWKKRTQNRRGRRPPPSRGNAVLQRSISHNA